MRPSSPVYRFLGAVFLFTGVAVAWTLAWLAIGAVLDNWTAVTAWRR